MLRAVRRRLLLESCEDRSLPSGLAPTAHQTTPNSSTAHTSTAGAPAQGADAPDDDDAEYATDVKSATTSTPNAEYVDVKATGSQANGQLEYLTASPTYYAQSYYPSSPPLPTGPATPIVVGSHLPIASTAPATVVANAQEVLQAPPPQQSPVIRTVATPAPAPPQQVDDIGPPTGTQGATEIPPPVSDIDAPPVGPVSSGIPFLDDPDIQVNLDGWAQAATRLFDGLDAMTSPLDGESPWVRLGYWVLAVGTVGVSIELTRQGLRSTLPEPEDVPELPVVR